jgi:hypothetical protein
MLKNPENPTSLTSGSLTGWMAQGPTGLLFSVTRGPLSCKKRSMHHRMWIAKLATGLLVAGTALRAAEAPVHPEPARTKGWSWKTPPDQVRPVSGKRSHLFYVGEPVTFKLAAAAVTYEVRDYWGELVDHGPAGPAITLPVKTPGWYKLYVYGQEARKEWGDIVGTTTFVIFRNDPRFPALPPAAVPGGTYPSMDEPLRGVLGMGPQRHAVRGFDKLDEVFKGLGSDVGLDAQFYLPFDAARKRALMVAFPNGTKGKLEAVRQVVERFKNEVRYWEPRNEPNFGASGAGFVTNELMDFHRTVKSVDPSLRVMGPGTVSIGPQLQGWLEDFFKEGGGRYLDVFSFHIYNGINGDLFLARKTLDNLQATLARHGLERIEKWQTEQGFFACVYGSYQPRLQSRWTLLELMVFEQYGIPREHNHLWYDRSHGFWDVPTWWENEDGSLNPAAALVRVFAEELHGKTFARALDFGQDGNKLYLGSAFTGGGKTVAVLMNAGCGVGEVELRVTGAGALHTVSAFGVASEAPVANGIARLSVPEIPVYVELEAGQRLEVVPQNWGQNLARLPGVTATASGSGMHPVDRKIPNDIAKIHNGEYENWYWAQNAAAHEWMDDTRGFPAWVELGLPSALPVARVVVFCGVPWQWRGTFLDHELQCEKDGQWVTIRRVQEPARTFGVYSPPTRTTVDSFFSDRWIFEHRFAPVTTRKIRLLVHDTTFGGGATSLVAEAGGQTGPHQITLREVEIYGPTPGGPPRE